MNLNRRDLLILEYLREAELMLPPKVLYLNMERDRTVTFTETTLKNRLSYLKEHGLVEQPIEDKGYYTISEKGIEVLENQSS